MYEDECSYQADASDMRELEQLMCLEYEDATELLLVRHGRPAADGSVTSGLGVEGRDQVEALAHELSEGWVEAIYCAPEAVALQTAQVLAGRLGRTFEKLPDLREVESQPFLDGGMRRCVVPTLAELFDRRPRWDSLPGFECSRDFRRRSIQTIEAIVGQHPGRRVVVVTHASVINAYLSMVLEIPRDLFFAPAFASVSAVRSYRDHHAVRSLNDTSHLHQRWVA